MFFTSAPFRPSEYLRPNTQREVIRTLQKYGEKAKVVGGGTDIYGLANRGLLSDVRALIDLRRLGLNYVKRERNAIRIGASTTLTDLFFSRNFHGEAYAAVKDALEATRPVQVKNAATVAGCICSALPFFDLPTALIALESRLRIAGPTRSRLVSLEKFYVDYFKLDLRRGEFVTEILLETFPQGTGSAFEKFAITADDWALVNAAAILTRSSKDSVKWCRVSVGGSVGPTPIRATAAEKALIGKQLENGDFERAGELASKQIQPEDDIRASAEYRRELCEVLVARVLKKAWERAE